MEPEVYEVTGIAELVDVESDEWQFKTDTSVLNPDVLVGIDELLQSHFGAPITHGGDRINIRITIDRAYC